MMTGGMTRIGAGRNARVAAVSVTACSTNNKYVTIYYNTDQKMHTLHNMYITLMGCIFMISNYTNNSRVFLHALNVFPYSCNQE